MKSSNFIPNTNNITSNFYLDLNNIKVPFLEVNPENSTKDFEVILFHGASPYGEEHPSMINLALALANCGIKVYIPKLPKLTELEITSETIDLILHFYLMIKKNSPQTNIVPAGISFGGGLLLKAMIRKELKKYTPNSILTYGTYFSLETSIDFLITGKINNEGNEEYVKPNDWGLIVLFHNYLSGIKTGFDTEQMQKVLKLRVKNLVSESEKEFEKLPKFQQNILIDIYNSNQTEDIIKMTKEMKKVFKKEMKEVSPSEICNKINFKVFLMHGANDSMVPYTESIKLHKNLNNSLLFLSGLYEHREISTGNSILQKFGELKRMSNFFTKFMDYNEK